MRTDDVTKPHDLDQLGGDLVFDRILYAYQAFEEHGSDPSLVETLHLLDLLSGGAVTKTNQRLLEDPEIDLVEVARQRAWGVPLEYIVGRAVFMGSAFRCSRDTLIPRQETELLVRTALAKIKDKDGTDRPITVIDVGTGCGNIALSIAMNAEHTRVLASDISPAAVAVAAANVKEFGLEHRVALFCGDLLSPFRGTGYEGRIDLIVCNPPYIPTSSLRGLASEVADHEPILALDGGAYGIDIYRRLISESVGMLASEGMLLFEIGAGQERLVTRLLEKGSAYQGIEYFRDGDTIRVVGATR